MVSDSLFEGMRWKKAEREANLPETALQRCPGWSPRSRRSSGSDTQRPGWGPWGRPCRGSQGTALAWPIDCSSFWLCLWCTSGRGQRRGSDCTRQLSQARTHTHACTHTSSRTQGLCQSNHIDRVNNSPGLFREEFGEATSTAKTMNRHTLIMVFYILVGTWTEIIVAGKMTM